MRSKIVARVRDMTNMSHNSDDDELPDGVGVDENGHDIGDENSDDIEEDLPDGGHPPSPHPYSSSLVTHPC